jgi:hypothetical protein
MQRFLTVQHASVVSGIDIETLIALGSSGQFEMHPKTRLIDPQSFSRWREQRHVQEKAESSGRQAEQYVQILAQLGYLRRQVSSLEDYLRQGEYVLIPKKFT